MKLKNNKIYLSPPHMGKKEQIIVKRAFNSNWITTKGPQLDSFEKKISNYINIKNVAAVSSGTAAIHLALILLGIKKDDCVFIEEESKFDSSKSPIYLSANFHLLYQLNYNLPLY